MIINSNKIGYGAQASGFSSMAIGDNANVTRKHGIALGFGATVSGFSGIAIGNSALVKDTDPSPDIWKSIVIGHEASALNGWSNVIVGCQSAVTTANATVVGANCTVSGGQAIAIGVTVNVAGGYGIAMGFQSSVSNNGSIALNSSDTAPYQFTIGSNSNPTTDMYFGKGVRVDSTFTGDTTNASADIANTSVQGQIFIGDRVSGPNIPAHSVVTNISGNTITVSNPATATASAQTFLYSLGAATIHATNATDGSDNDIPSTDLVLAAGQSVGTGDAGSVRLKTAFAATASGNSSNILVDRIHVNAIKKPLTSATTINLFSVTGANNSAFGGEVFYTIFVTDGALEFGTQVGRFQWVGYVDGGGSYISSASADTTFTVQQSSLTNITAVAPGTDGAQIVQISVTTALSATEFDITYTIVNNSPAAITVL